MHPIVSERERLMAAAARHGARNLRVFGSRARGDARPDSDYDFLVDMDRGRSLLDIIGLEQSLAVILGQRVDVVASDELDPRLRSRILHDARPV